MKVSSARNAMESLVLTLDPHVQSGVVTMQRAMCAAHVRLGLVPRLVYARLGRFSRYDPRLHDHTADGQLATSSGYWPTFEFMNPLVPALTLRSRVRRAAVVQIVTGFHSLSLVPILARRPFVSWVATPFLDEIAGRHDAGNPTMSVRLNYGMRSINQALETLSYRFPRTAFALSDYTARRLTELTHHPRERFEVLRYPIDTAVFKADGPAWLRAPARYVLAVGRVDEERKNYRSLVRCFSRIAAEHPGVSLVIAGPIDPATSGVAAYASELGLGDRVVLPGSLQGAELASAYRGADAFVMTSRQEGLGIVVLEAQATSVPPIVMRCGGSDELIDHGKDGWLVDQGDEDTFASTLSMVLGDESARCAVGQGALKRVQLEASFELFDKKLARAYFEAFEFRARTAENQNETNAESASL